MILDFLEVLNDYPFVLLLIIVSIATLGGGIPPILERRRRRGLENAISEVLELLSDNIGAGEGIQQGLARVAEVRNDLFGKLISDAIQASKATSFNAAMAEMAVKSRSKQVQRVINLILTSLESDAPMQDVLFEMSQEYSRLNKLVNKRDTELQSSAFLIIFFVGLMLPAIIAFMIGIFAPKSSGMVVGDLNSIMAYFFGGATAIAVLISGRMLGRMMNWFWFVPSLALMSMLIYILGFEVIS
jgi:Flp pilus assembly protein TadB